VLRSRSGGHRAAAGATVKVDDRWPTPVVTWPRGTSDRQALDFTAHLEGWARRKSRFVLVVDGTQASPLSVAGRTLVVSEMRRLEPALRPYLMGVGLVLDSSVLQGVLTAITWLWTPPFEVRVCGSRSSAMEWASRRLESTRREPSKMPKTHV